MLQQAEKEDEKWMGMALELARVAAQKGEVPVGAVLVRDGRVLAKTFNLKEHLGSALGHAECLAIHRASMKLGGWRLGGSSLKHQESAAETVGKSTLYVTLEPCLMCAGAIQQARIDRVVFGASDPKGGAVRSLYQVLEDQRLNHRCEIVGGVLAEPCGRVLTDFFQKRRGKD